jgi:hypothetical protein
MANVIKYHLSYDGNPIGLFNTLDEAEYQAAMDSGWTEEEYQENFAFAKSQCNKYGGDSLYFFDRIVLDEQGNIVAINEQPFDEFIQDTYVSIDDEDVVTIKQKVTEYYTM